MTAYGTIIADLSRPDAHTVEVSLAGDLVYDTGDHVVDWASTHLAGHPGTRVVQLDCRNLGFCDSYGLSVLLMTRRVVHAAGAHLQIANMPPQLVRVLTITGTLDHLTAAARTGQREHRET